MKNLIKIVVITMSMLLVGCGEVGPDGKIYVSFTGMGLTSLDVTGAETTCVYGFCSLGESVTVNGEELPGYMLSSGSIDYSYTYDTLEDADDDGENDIATGSVEFTVTPNLGGDASGFDDGTGGIDKVCAVSITCAGTCSDALICYDVGNTTTGEMCTIVDGVQVCVSE